MKHNRKLKFQFITDNRFERHSKDILKTIIGMNTELKNKLSKLPVKIDDYGPRKLSFTDHDQNGKSYEIIQYRIDYYLEKTGKITWNDIMIVINSIQAPYYKFI